MSIRVDEVIHAPNRLAICALLSSAGAVEFGVIRDELGVADSVASKHLKVLVDVGYVSTETRPDATSKRPRNWASLTATGRDAFGAYAEHLQRIIDAAGSA
ncbi:transcriptional regulator [Arenivirga flava]|uniref:MarR family transcriptional regulator n=1 Tax=Arenivirga flava TaxID=1930060 RepID=A0AA37XCV5_9MICO|nr:transcriptional regulator [Arenivirga flava]GMA28907.1 MarR family transcriptional regulator [Arenivirga flava]